ncbi:FtsX-like permease family protein [Ornithinimicrobium cerasi]|uniref:Putative ABC transport system permease protein n=1 Tax=Ornithinimicrobium cerasi TaxID=2248773 RepID=A0A285VVQ3_9MICO|nr:ABC transporter permease [Ornithinimicrobium cerasi]SOC56711.1 putative ABC transport system permease protein [Ornithinimicrobium cerasi]
MGTWLTAGLMSRGRRLLSAAVAIIIGVAFLTTSLAAVTTAQRGMEDALGAGLREADLVVTGEEGAPVPLEVHDELASVEELAAVRGRVTVSAELGPEEWVMGATLPSVGVTLLDGRLAKERGEVVVDTDLAERAPVGEVLTVRVLTADDDTATGDRDVVELDVVELDVVGVADFGDGDPVLSYGPAFVATDATLRDVDPALTYDALMLDLAAGADEEAARTAILGGWGEAVVQTGPEAAAERVSRFTGGTDALAAMLLGFGAVALATAAIVIANTFTITLAQRTGELALLRAVGATRAQVRRLVLLEALLLGLVASAVGVGLGLLGARGLLGLSGRFDLGMPLATEVAVTPLILGVPLAVGAVVTVAASLWPAVRATRVSPLAALRPDGEAARGRRTPWVRLVLATVLVGAGVAAMGYAATHRDLLSGVAGGLMSFGGVLVAGVVVVPTAVLALGLVARTAGVPGRLAVDNAVRNPGRAAATSAALLVGVTLITMTSVGAASAERTALGEIDGAYAVDVLVEGSGRYAEAAEGAPAGSGDEDPAAEVVPEPLAAEVLARVAAAEGVETARAVETAYLSVGEEWAPTATLGLDPARDGDVVRSSALADLVPGTLGLSNAMMAIYGLEAGDGVTVSGPGGSADLRVVELAVGYQVAVNVSDLRALGGDDVATGAVLVRLAHDADVAEAMSAVREVADDAGLAVSGAAMERAVITQVLDVLVLVTTALLGVAVLIAVVGIANTLSLSVVERHREHALLRGLGLTRGQMRLMLLTEGVLLAVVSTILGLAIGVGYVALGVQTVLPAGTALQLSVPWVQVGAIVGVAVLAGVLASVLPARRATRVSPVEGLVAT